MYEIKTVLALLVLLVTASFCICRVHTEKKVGQQSGDNIENVLKKEVQRLSSVRRLGLSLG